MTPPVAIVSTEREASCAYGRLLRGMRCALGKNMGQLADKLGVSVVVVSDVERGVRQPFDDETTRRIVEWLAPESRDGAAGEKT